MGSGRRRVRLVARPSLAAGPLKDLKDVLYELYLEAGPQTLDEIADDVRRLAGELSDELPGGEDEVDSLIGAVPRRDTIARIIGGQDVPPSQQDVVAVAVALARAAGRLSGRGNPGEVAALAGRVRQLWARARAAPPPTRLGRPIGEYTPLMLEVHRAIDLGGETGLPGTLPLYVPRQHDNDLRNKVDSAAAGHSAMVTLVGESSTGKTRACWEAVQSLPAQWCLWHPIDPGRPEAAVQALHEVGPRTVVWLNEAQHYLLTADPRLGEQIAAGLRTLLADSSRGPVLILATTWPQYWAALTKPHTQVMPDPLSQVRHLLAGTDIRVPDAFADTDLDTLRRSADRDPRLRDAIAHAEGGRITQYLAGVPELLQRYRNAPSSARALIDAAIDARRFGHPPALPYELLELAAPGYLTDHEWAQADQNWLEYAFTYAAMPCHGTAGPVIGIRPRPDVGASAKPSHYRLADYLEQNGWAERAALFAPRSFWDAVAATVTDPELLRSMGGQAARRGRLQCAARLYRQAIHHGSILALTALAHIYRRTGDQAQAEMLARQAADKGETAAMWSLARWREQAGDRGDTEDFTQRAAAQGTTVALRGLAEMRRRAGDRAGAQELHRQAAEHGDTIALRALAQIHERSGDRAEAESLYRQAADRGDTVAMRGLVWIHEGAGDPAGALRWAVRAADQGDTIALRSLARIRERAGDSESATDLYRQAADRSDNVALRALARMREQAGDREAANALAHTAARRGAPTALRYLADLRAQAGDLDSANDLYRQAADRGDNMALRELARNCTQVGDRAKAEALILEAANRGSARALHDLAKLRQSAGDKVNAERIRRFGINEQGQPASSLE